MNTSSSTTVAHARNIHKSYGTGATATVALDGVDLEIEKGRVTAIMGPSGSGKSTLMHLLAGLDTPTSGSITLGDIVLDGLDDNALTRLRRRQVGFVFQSFNLVPTLSVLGNVILPFEPDGRSPNSRQLGHIQSLLTDLGLWDLRARRPHELSGGQQQRVAIVRALALDPTLIVADEPTGNLDSRAGRTVLRLLVDATRIHNQSVVLVTHDPVAASFADRVVFIVDGRIAHDRDEPSDSRTLTDIALQLEESAS